MNKIKRLVSETELDQNNFEKLQEMLENDGFKKEYTKCKEFENPMFRIVFGRLEFCINLYKNEKTGQIIVLKYYHFDHNGLHRYILDKTDND